MTCALCGPGARSKVRPAERIQQGPYDFAARKTPDRQHFRIVECLQCGLVYDVEHIYLFDHRAVASLLERTGFDVVETRNIPNSYTLEYSFKMFPLPRNLKQVALTAVRGLGISNWRLRLPAGNMIAVGQKPRRTRESMRRVA